MGFLAKLFGFSGGSLFSGPRVSPKTREKLVRDWEKIDTLLRVQGPSQLRQALITSDKSLDNALKDLVAGNTMGERLKNSSHLFEKPMYDKIWRAHKMRNSVVHESDFEPPYHVLIKNTEVFRRALKLLGVEV